MRRLASLLCLLAAPTACGGAEDPSGTGATSGTECVGPECTEPLHECSAGFAAQPEAGCAPILPATECPAGTRPAIGSADCSPVGWTDCPPGFETHPSGWGCTARVPPTACKGATRDAVGSEECVPIGDCSAPFPPADADHFVRADYLEAELDGTHFRTIQEALDAAPAGAVIAVDEGTYLESLFVNDPVSLIGRCAEKVVLQSADNGIGVQASTDGEVTLRGLTIAGHLIGVLADGSSLTLEDSLLTANRWVGAVAVGGASSLTMRRSVVRDMVRTDDGPTHSVAVGLGAQAELAETAIVNSPYAALVIDDQKAAVSVVDTVIRDSHPEPEGAWAGRGGFGALVTHGASVDIDRSVLLDNHATGIGVTSADKSGNISTARVRRTIVRAQKYDDYEAARGLEVADGARMDVEDSMVSECPETQVIVEGPGSVLHAERLTLRTDVPEGEPQHGMGVVATEGGRVELGSSAVVETRIFGLLVQLEAEIVADASLVAMTMSAIGANDFGDQPYGLAAAVLPGAHLTLTSSSLVHNRSMGVFVRGEGASASLTGTLVDDTLPGDDGAFGRGINVQDGARLDVISSAVLRSHDTGIIAFGSQFVLTDSVVAATARGSSPEWGDKIAIDVAVAVGSHLEANGSTLSASPDIGLIVSASSAFMSGGFLANNSIALHVQDGSVLVEQDAPSPDPLTVVISSQTRFLANQTRLGTGVVPMPTPMGAPSP